MAKSPINSVEPRVVVGLDFGTTYSGFAFAHVTDPEKIYAHFDYPKATGEKHYCKTVTACYYKIRADGVGGWKFKSWGYPARAEYEKDILTVRRHRSSDPNEDPSQPTIGQFFVRFKLHLASSSSAPSTAPKLPDWLKVDVLITDYLREMGGLILRTLQDHYGAGMTKEAIQWCITVPSIWDFAAKAVMKNCMVNAGLVGGVDGSPHPLVMVLEPEAASFHCHKVMNEEFLEVGDKLLVADIGGGTSDIVVQEVISAGSNYRVKEVTTSSGGLCGGTYVDARFMEFMHRTIGPCFRECLERHPNVQVALMKSWETAKSSFGDPATRGETIDLNLPPRLVALWEAYDQRLGNPERESYDELEITYKQMQSIFDPVVKENLRLISRQLDQVGTVKMLVVVGGFAASPYLMENIRRRFSGVVSHILSPPNPGSAVCQGAVALALNPDTIESRVCKRTYGFSCTYKFDRGVDPPEYMKVVDGVEKCRRRFQIFVRKGDKVRVDSCISRIQRPVTRGQKSIRFQLFSSDEIEPRYALGHSVKKEGEIVIDISRDMQKDKGREVKLSLFFGRSSLEVKAEAVNFMIEGPQQHLELPVEVDYCSANSPVHIETFKTF